MTADEKMIVANLVMAVTRDDRKPYGTRERVFAGSEIPGARARMEAAREEYDRKQAVTWEGLEKAMTAAQFLIRGA